MLTEKSKSETLFAFVAEFLRCSFPDKDALTVLCCYSAACIQCKLYFYFVLDDDSCSAPFYCPPCKIRPSS